MKETTKVHLIYIIAILVGSNILTLTIKWGDLKELVSYLNFAATLASLLLAILAIVYSYLSGGSLASYTEKVESAGKRLDIASECIQQATAKFGEITQSLPAAFKNIDEKVSRTHDLVTNLSTTAADEKTDSIEAPSTDISVSLLRLAVASSPSGLLTMLAACVAYRNKRHFVLKELLENTFVEPDYFHGWIMALDAADIIDVKNESKRWTIVSIPDDFEELIEVAIKDRLAQEDIKKEWREEFRSTVTRIKERLVPKNG